MYKSKYFLFGSIVLLLLILLLASCNWPGGGPAEEQKLPKE